MNPLHTVGVENLTLIMLRSTPLVIFRLGGRYDTLVRIKSRDLMFDCIVAVLFDCLHTYSLRSALSSFFSNIYYRTPDTNRSSCLSSPLVPWDLFVRSLFVVVFVGMLWTVR